jgi:hypothetical protein
LTEPGAEVLRLIATGQISHEVADHRFLATPDVARFFAELTAHVAHLPLTAEGTADMPLATLLLHWQRGADASPDEGTLQGGTSGQQRSG